MGAYVKREPRVITVGLYTRYVNGYSPKALYSLYELYEWASTLICMVILLWNCCYLMEIFWYAKVASYKRFSVNSSSTTALRKPDSYEPIWWNVAPILASG